MGLDEQVQWNPSTEVEQAFKETIVALYKSNDNALATSSDGQSNRFILHSKGYFDLRAYVLTGKDFPSNRIDFQDKMPKSAFAKLTEIDATIYDRTQTTMIEIGESCSEYHSGQLSQLVTASSSTADYSSNALNMIEKADGINLRHDLDLLMDPKYKTPADQDAAFKDAREAAQMTLKMLKDEATRKETETKDIVRGLLTFKEVTMKAEADVQYLNRQYKTGPVTNSSSMKDPYLDYLNKALKDNIEKFNAKVEEANDTYSDWQEATGIACGTAFLGPIGWIAMGIEAAKAAELRAHYDELMEQIEQLKQERQEETVLIEYVTQLTTSYTDIDSKMSTAITAMSELASLFTEQASCFDNLVVNLDGMWNGTASDSLVNRQYFINYYMDKTIEKLHEIQQLAEEFANTIITDIDIDSL